MPSCRDSRLSNWSSSTAEVNQGFSKLSPALLLLQGIHQLFFADDAALNKQIPYSNFFFGLSSLPNLYFHR